MAFRHKLGTSGDTPAATGTSLGAPRSARSVPAHLSDMDSEPRISPTADSIITLSELAQQLGVPVQTLYDLRSQGRGPRGFRIGRELRFRAAEVDAWLLRLEDQDRARHLPAGSR